MLINYYKTLGFEPINGQYTHITKKNIKEAYYKLALQYHPDKQINELNAGNNDKLENEAEAGNTDIQLNEDISVNFKIIQDAYEVLYNEYTRSELDKKLCPASWDIFLVSSLDERNAAAEHTTELVSFAGTATTESYNFTEWAISSKIDARILLSSAESNYTLGLAFLTNEKIYNYLNVTERFQLLLILLKNADMENNLEEFLNEIAVQTLISEASLKEHGHDFVNACILEITAAIILLNHYPHLTQYLNYSSLYRLAQFLPYLLNDLIAQHNDRLTLDGLMTARKTFGEDALAKALTECGLLEIKERYLKTVEAYNVLYKNPYFNKDHNYVQNIFESFDLELIEYLTSHGLNSLGFQYRFGQFLAHLSMDDFIERSKSLTDGQLNHFLWVIYKYLLFNSSLGTDSDTDEKAKMRDEAIQRMLALISLDIPQFFYKLLSLHLDYFTDESLKQKSQDLLLSKNSINGDYIFIERLRENDKNAIYHCERNPKFVEVLLNFPVISKAELYQLVPKLGQRNEEAYLVLKAEIGLSELITNPVHRDNYYSLIKQDKDLETLSKEDKDYFKAIKFFKKNEHYSALVEKLGRQRISNEKIQQALSLAKRKSIPFELVFISGFQVESWHDIFSALVSMDAPNRKVFNRNWSERYRIIIRYIEESDGAEKNSLLLIKVLNVLFNDMKEDENNTFVNVYDDRYLLERLSSDQYLIILKEKHPLVLSNLIMTDGSWNVIHNNLKKNNIEQLNILQEQRNKQITEIKNAIKNFDSASPNVSLNNIIDLIKQYGLCRLSYDRLSTSMPYEYIGLLSHRLLQLDCIYVTVAQKDKLKERCRQFYSPMTEAKLDINAAKEYILANQKSMNSSDWLELMDIYGDALTAFLKENNLWKKFQQIQILYDKLNAVATYRIEQGYIGPEAYEKSLFAIIQKNHRETDLADLDKQFKDYLFSIPPESQTDTVKSLSEYLAASEAISLPTLLLQHHGIPECFDSLLILQEYKLMNLHGLISLLITDAKNLPLLGKLADTDLINFDDFVNWSLDEGTRNICSYIIKQNIDTSLFSIKLQLIIKLLQLEAKPKYPQPLQFNEEKQLEASKLLFELIRDKNYERALALLVLKVNPLYIEAETKESIVHVLVQQANLECRSGSENLLDNSALYTLEVIIRMAVLEMKLAALEPDAQEKLCNTIPEILMLKNIGDLIPIDLATELQVIQVFTENFPADISDSLHYNVLLFQNILKGNTDIAKLLIDVGACPIGYINAETRNNIFHMLAKKVSNANSENEKQLISDFFSVIESWLKHNPAQETKYFYADLLMTGNMEAEEKTPLMLAAAAGNITLIQAFHQRLGWNALHGAIYADDKGLAANLSANTALCWEQDIQARTPLRLAMQLNRWDCLVAALPKNPLSIDDPKARGLGEYLYNAVCLGKCEAAEHLLYLNADINWQIPDKDSVDGQGSFHKASKMPEPLLHIAVMTRNRQMFQLLLTYVASGKIDLQKKNTDGYTITQLIEIEIITHQADLAVLNDMKTALDQTAKASQGNWFSRLLGSKPQDKQPQQHKQPALGSGQEKFNASYLSKNDFF